MKEEQTKPEVSRSDRSETVLASEKGDEGELPRAARRKVMGRGHGLLVNKAIMDDLPEEVTLELRLEGWEETCHGRTEKNRQRARFRGRNTSGILEERKEGSGS